MFLCCVASYHSRTEKHFFLFNSCRCNISRHRLTTFWKTDLSDSFLTLCTCQGAWHVLSIQLWQKHCFREEEVREAAVNKSKSGSSSVFISEGERETEMWRATYSTESSASRLLPGNVQLGRLATVQRVGGCEKMTEGVVTGSNWEQTLILDTSFKRKGACCPPPNCEMMSMLRSATVVWPVWVYICSSFVHHIILWLSTRQSVNRTVCRPVSWFSVCIYYRFSRTLKWPNTSSGHHVGGPLLLKA